MAFLPRDVRIKTFSTHDTPLSAAGKNGTGVEWLAENYTNNSCRTWSERMFMVDSVWNSR